MIPQLIRQARKLRTESSLTHVCSRQYAFIGMGSHSMANLYPVLAMLHVPLKYICVTSPRKARLISRQLNTSLHPSATTATTSLDTVLSDPDVSAVFLSASPAAHFRLSSEVMQSGKALFVEKPPCRTLSQLEQLIFLQASTGTFVQVGMQKRFAPSVRTLKSRLDGIHGPCHYLLRYCMGRYPEGDPLSELFIHPLDLVCHLFGPARLVASTRSSSHTLLLMLAHGSTVGTLELSTGYSWDAPVEQLSVCTPKGLFALSSISTLTFQPFPSSVGGIPWEKIRHSQVFEEHLCRHDDFSPTLASSLWVEHGFYHELQSFVAAVEHPVSFSSIASLGLQPTLQSLRPVYELMQALSPLF